jgi:hypothetical protein
LASSVSGQNSVLGAKLGDGAAEIDGVPEGDGDDLPQDPDVLRTLVRHNRMQIGDFGQFPCAGVYAVVAAPGTVRTGDHVTVV